MMQTCLCCGFKTLSPKSIHDICPICYWQDDDHSWDDPANPTGGPNGSDSLHDAQRNYIAHGSCMDRELDSCRKPIESDILDPKWKPFLSDYTHLRK